MFWPFCTNHQVSVYLLPVLVNTCACTHLLPFDLKWSSHHCHLCIVVTSLAPGMPTIVNVVILRKNEWRSLFMLLWHRPLYTFVVPDFWNLNFWDQTCFSGFGFVSVMRMLAIPDSWKVSWITRFMWSKLCLCGSFAGLQTGKKRCLVSRLVNKGHNAHGMIPIFPWFWI